ncbi:YcnI family protein [Nocardia sp. NPDC127579]|uniref:YcnI family copper-binding membrane protein n=1 Tax=Nocardia sp. NPDC127579 TaxID=3345402 RepID=UPI003630A484
MRSSVLRACGTVAPAIGLVLLAGGTAAAHVSVDAPGAQQGKYSVATFRVPNESETAATTALTVTLPGVTGARTEPIPGWTAKVEKNDKNQVVAVTWTADPGNPGIGTGQFQRFAVSIGPLPKQETVSFPAKQTYSDGKIVNWDQPAGPDGSEPEHPAPTLTLAAGRADAEDGHQVGATASAPAATDDTARWLGGAGLALGILGVAMGIGNTLRGRKS